MSLMNEDFVKSLKLDATQPVEALKHVTAGVKETYREIDKTVESSEKKRSALAVAETKLRIKQEETLKARIQASSKEVLAQIKAESDAKKMEYAKDMQARKASADTALQNQKLVNALILENEKQTNRQALADHKAKLSEEARLAREARAEQRRQERQAAKERKQLAQEEIANQTRIANQITNVYSMMATKVLASFRNMFTEAYRYAKEFDAQLTSIAIVTGDASQKSRLGEQYEDMAQEMRVTSIEIAEAAEQLYRQGLGSEEEVNNRLKVITQYAKISGLTFTEAVEAMTASINAFTKDGESGADTAQRIADTWAYLGDSVATSSAEIGRAMQKVASSGQAAGIGLEKLSSYIAVIEAYTRAAPESVGTALNSMMARYMKVTAKGFGESVTTDEGDVVSINDIAKALETAGISVYTAGEGFMEFGDVLDAVAAKWETLNDDQRNYIATQVAGTRGLNYFLALMDGYGQTLELTAGAYDSAGVAAQKFAIWQSGLEAQLNELDAAVKDLYSDLLNSDVIKTFVGYLTTLVQWFGKVTEATNGWNVKLALLAAGILMVGRAYTSLKTAAGTSGVMNLMARSFFGVQGAATGATVAITGMRAALVSVGVGLAVGVIATLIGSFASMAQSAEETKEKLSELTGDYARNNSDAKSMGAQMEALRTSLENGTVTTEEYLDARRALIDQYPELEGALYNEQTAVNNLEAAYAQLIETMGQKTGASLYSNYTTAKGSRVDAATAYDVAASQFYRSTAGTSEMGAWAMGQFLDRNGRVKTDAFGKWTIKDLQDAVAGLETYKEAYEHSAKEIASMDSLSAELRGYIAVRTGELTDEMQNAIATIVESAVNPYLYEDIQDVFPLILEKMMSVDYGPTMGADNIALWVSDWFKQNADVVAGASEEELAGIIASIGQEFTVDVIRERLQAAMGYKSDAMNHGYHLALGRLEEIGFLSLSNIDQMKALTDYLGQFETVDDRSSAFGRVKREAEEIFKSTDLEAGPPVYNSVWDMVMANMGVAVSGGEAVVGEDPLKGLSLRDQMNAIGSVNTPTGRSIDPITTHALLDVVLGRELAEGRFSEALGEMAIEEAQAIMEGIVAAWSKGLKDNDYSGIFDYLLENMDFSPEDIDYRGSANMDEYTQALTKAGDINALFAAQQAMSAGEELSGKDLKSLVESYEELLPYLGNEEALREQIAEILARETAEYGNLLDKYGLAVSEAEDLSQALISNVTASNKASAAITKLQKGQRLTATELQTLVKEYPEVTDELYQFVNGNLSAEEAMNALWKAQANANAENFAKSVQTAISAIDDLTEGTDEYEKALDNLGTLFAAGFGDDMSSFEFASQYIDDIRAAAEGSEEALRRLQEAAFIHITGSSDVDFSAVENGLYTVDNLSKQALEVLQKMGLFEIQTVELPQTYYDLVPDTGFTGGGARFDDGMLGGGVTYRQVKRTVTNKVTVLKLKDPFTGLSSGDTKPKSSGGGRSGGGGGGGSKSSSNTSAAQQKIAELENMTTATDYRLKIAEAWEEYYNQTGELTKTIPYIEEEIRLHQELMDSYAKNRKELEPMALDYKAQVDAIEAQIASLKTLRDQYTAGSYNYKQYDKQITDLEAKLEELLPDYEALVETVDGYALSEINAKKAIDELNERLKEQRTAIRTLRADMKNTVSGYLDDLKEQQRALVDATISMQDTVLEILREEAQRELDIEKEKLEGKKELLSEELSALRDNFNEAKAMADKQAKEDELREKQRQLAVLSTDPTKAKQRAKLEQEIADMRKDMAWDAAEEEVSSREDSVQQEIDGLDELIDANRKAYDEISGYSEELINQMYDVMRKTEDEMVSWLREHSTDYAESTREAQGKMVEEWTDTLDTIYGVIRTNWPEVEDLMMSGLDQILEKLKQTKDYMTANTETQTNMVESLSDDWQDMLDSVKVLSETERATNQKSIYDQAGASNPQAESEEKKAEDAGAITTTTNGRFYIRKGWDTKSDAYGTIPDGATVTVDGYHGSWYRTTWNGITGWVNMGAFKGIDKTKLKKYARGGIIDYTGPAMVDGTPGRPEGILNADQLQLLNRWVFALERLSEPSFGENGDDIGGITVEPGGIVINVGSLSGNEDYEEAANGIMEAIYEKFKVRR